MDSGPSAHMCKNLSSFKNSTLINPSKTTGTIGDGMKLDIIHQGTVEAFVIAYGKSSLATFSNVLYLPKLQFNLLSVSQIWRKGYTINSTDDNHQKGICQVVENY